MCVDCCFNWLVVGADCCFGLGGLVLNGGWFLLIFVLFGDLLLGFC